MENGGLKRYYGEVWGYVVAVRVFIAFAVAVFLLAAIVAAAHPQIGTSLVAMFRQFARGLHGESAPALMLAIFIKNASTSAISIVLGAILGLVPLLSALGNGVLLGVVAQQHFSALWRIIPHGIFELPAVFIAWGFGIWIALWPLQSHPFRALAERLRRAAHVFFAIIVPLLIVAAVIEGAAAAMLWAGRG